MTGFSDGGSPDGQPVRLSYVAAAAPSGPTEFVLLGPYGRVIGRLRFRTCRPCRTGRILDICICDAWQRQGLERELGTSPSAPSPSPSSSRKGEAVRSPYACRMTRYPYRLRGI